MPGQNMSEKWWSNTRRFRSKVGDISCRISYSSGTAVGSLLVATGLFVDQAKVWADPQATRLIFLPCKAATNLGLCMALVLPSPEIIKNMNYWHFLTHFVSNSIQNIPSWPSSLSPQVKTSPWSVQATQCSDPVAMDMTFFPCKAATFFGLRTWSSLPWPRRW